MIGVSPLAENGRIQLNVRISKETSDKLDEIVEYYQENLKLGRVYKGDVLTDIIEKSYELMNKQKKGIKRY
ncbi:hypothetical protein ACIQAA_28670 [Neobacillus sp. NPDC093182]|uniref:hypothetical protein n=1 Tax=Neobacillus sp. NPDC093182 TaxID=3364297 RepID=UPI00381AF7CA